jgi:hypothetical protein
MAVPILQGRLSSANDGWSDEQIAASFLGTPAKP